MRTSISLAVAVLAALAGVGSAGAAPKAVVELFTSQGCASCKPADEYLGELAARRDVIALALHVDYWDYLGWPDSFARPENTARQKQYAEVRGSRRIFTPQMTVNGSVDLVGSDRAGVDAAIRSASLPVPVTMRRGSGTVEIEVGEHPTPGSRSTTIRLVLLASEAKVAIARGENAGSTITYYNVVRAMRPIGMWNGHSVKVTLPEAELMSNGIDGCVVLVQEDLANGPGAIIGAAEIGDW